MNADQLLAHYDRIADAPDAITRLRRFVLNLAVRGKLVEQDPADGNGASLLVKVERAWAARISSGKIKKIKKQKVWEPSGSSDVPFEVPSNWALVRLGQAVDLVNGRAFMPGDWTSTGLPIVRIQNLNNSIASFNRYDGEVKDKFLIDTGDFLISWSGTPGTSFGAHIWERGPAILNQHIFKSILIGDAFETPFLKLAINSRLFELIEQAHGGVGLQHITKPKLEAVVLTLPPLAEQQRIVAKVDELMALCDELEAAQAEREATRGRLAAASLARLGAPDPDTAKFRVHAAFALENLAPLTTRLGQIKALRQTILDLAVRGKLVAQDPEDEPASELLRLIAVERNHLVAQKSLRREKSLAAIDSDEPPFGVPSGWEWSRIGVAVLATQYGTSTKSFPSEQGVPLLTMGNIQGGLVVCRGEKKIPDTAEELPALYLKQFDLLYNRTNSAELVGKTGIYLGEDDCRTFASYLIRIKVSRKHFSPHFLNVAMNTPEFRETQIGPLIKKQTGQANVNGTALKNMLVPVPPLAEQHRINAKVDELMALCDRLKASLATSDDTRRRTLDALLHDALEPASREMEAAE